MNQNTQYTIYLVRKNMFGKHAFEKMSEKMQQKNLSLSG